MRLRRRKNWFNDERPKERMWVLKLGILILGGYALFMTGHEIYRVADEEGYRRGVPQGYKLGYEEGEASVACPQPWSVTMAAPTTIY